MKQELFFLSIFLRFCLRLFALSFLERDYSLPEGLKVLQSPKGYTKHPIALRWSQTFPGKLETEFSANKFFINAKTAALDSYT